MNHRLVFSVVMSLLLFGNSTGFAHSTTETTIDAGDLVLKFTRSDDGASLTSIVDYGLKGEEMQATHLAADETMNITKTSSTVPRRPDHPLTIPEKTVWAWEVHDRGQHHQ